MSRRAKGSLFITVEELEWARKLMDRKAQNTIPKMDKREERRIQLFNSLHKKIESVELADEMVLALNKNEIGMFHRFAKEERDALIAKVIPGYAEKIRNSPDQVDRLMVYKKGVEERANMLTALLNKLQVVSP